MCCETTWGDGMCRGEEGLFIYFSLGGGWRVRFGALLKDQSFVQRWCYIDNL